MDELSSTLGRMTLAEARSLCLNPVQAPATPKRKFVELDRLSARPPSLAKRPRYDTKAVISVPCPRISSRIARTLTTKRKRSILERLPNEIIAEIYLLSHNISLLHTCRTIRNALATDALFKQLVLAAFDRSDLCERHQERANHHKHCTFCRKVVEAGSTSVPEKPQDPEYDEYGEFKICGLNNSQPFYNWKRDCTGYSPGPRRVECIMPIREKRSLQNQILRSRYFRFHHLKAIEDACSQNKQCEREFSRAYNSMVSYIGLDPVPEFDFAALWTKEHHRHHLLHGVTFPKAILLGPLTAEGDQMLEKLLDWASGSVWSALGCGRDRNKVVSVFQMGIKRAIAADHLVTLKLLLKLTIFGTTATPMDPQGWGISICMIRDAYALGASTSAIQILLLALNWHTCNQSGEFRDAYRIVLDRAKGKKDDGKWEAWIYDALLAKRYPKNEMRTWDGWGSLFKESLRLAKTDPAAHFNSYTGKLVVASCSGVIQILNGATIPQSIPMITYMAGVGRFISHAKARLAAEVNATT